MKAASDGVEEDAATTTRLKQCQRHTDEENERQFQVQMELFPHANIEYQPVLLEHLPYAELMKSFKQSSLSDKQIMEEFREMNAKFKQEAAFYSSTIGHLESNVPKNRYNDVCPYDYNRATIDSNSKFYLNGSYIKDFNNCICAMVCQGPKADTVEHLYEFLVARKVHSLIAIGKPEELIEVDHGEWVEKEKFVCYWPDLGSSITAGDYCIENIYEDNSDENVTIRTLSIMQKLLPGREIKSRLKRMKHTVTQYHIHAWRDKESPQQALQTVIVYAVVNLLWKNPKELLVAHCSAGIGRSALVVWIYLILRSITQMLMPSDILAVDLLRHLRLFRKNMVQTEEQYLFGHQFLESIKLMLQTLLKEAVKDRERRLIDTVNDFGMPMLKKLVQHHLTKYMRNEMKRIKSKQ